MKSPFKSSGTGKRWSAAGFLMGITVILSLFIAACGGGGATTTTGGASTPTTGGKAAVAAPNDLITPGVLTVGSDTTYPPQEYIDTATNQATGFDVDLIKAVAERMGLKANIVTTNFDSIIDSLSSKRFDVVISAVTITDERKQKVDFVPYFSAGESLLVPKGNPKNLKLAADLCGYNVGVQNGTVEQDELQKDSDACKKAGKPEIKLTILKDQTAVVQLLATSRVDATYQDSPVTDYYLKQHPGAFDVGGSVFNAAPEGIVIRKNDASMFNAVQAAFNSLKADGTYKKIIDQWGLTSGAITEVDIPTKLA